jgi:hypothetical protein
MRTTAALTLALVVSTAAAATDYEIVRRTSIDDGDDHEQTEYWGPHRVVVDDPSQRTIVDFAAGTVTIIDKDGHSYSKIRLDDLRRGLLLVGTMIEELPPAARDLLGVGRDVTLSSNGNSTTIAGHRAREYGVGGEHVTGWVWLAEDLDPREILGDDAAAWWRAGGPLRAVGPLGDVARAIEKDNLKGMPVWAWMTVGSESGTATIASKVVSVDKESPPADIGRVPSSYRETSPG